MIKAVFFDIDGTLLSFKTHKVSDGTIEAFDKLHQRGIKTFISSGRALVLIPEFPVSFDGYITVNGGYCFVGDTIIHKNPICKAESQRWMRYADENGYVSMAFTEHEMYTNHIDDVARQLREQLEFEMPKIRPTEEILDQDIYQFIAMIPPEKDREVIEFLPHCRLPRWHPAFSDLVPYDSSKAVGMQKILDYFGYTREECAAFGDGGNDIEMLEYAGIGIAMGNAAGPVKQHADLVTTSVDEEGILRGLQQIGIIS